MERSKLASAILSLIESHYELYPIYTKEIEKKLEISNAKACTELRKLRKEGRIFSKRVTWTKGFRTFHILSNQQWPTFLSTMCRNCHYRSTIKHCIFHNDVYKQGCIGDISRIAVKMPKNVVGCPWYISRSTSWKKLPLEEFYTLSVSKSGDFVNQTNTHIVDADREDYFSEEDQTELFLPKYHCIFCSEEIPQLGVGFLPLLGSSVFRCMNCESLYKLRYDEKEEKFFVLCAEEFGDIYRHNFEQITGLFSETIVYSSNSFGISIPKDVDYLLDTNSEIFVVANWVGKLSSIEYIVVRNNQDYETLKEILAEDYSNIRVINGEDLLVSSNPTLEEIGIIKLLRETKLLNVAFCIATLESRKTVLSLLKGTVNEELRLESLQRIDKKIKKLKRFQILPAKAWNKIDMDAANTMYNPIKDFLKNEGIEFPGRCLGRHVKDPFKPFGLYYAYSVIDAIINGLMRITSNEIKQFCSDINFCWNGLPGICHGKTRGGIFGLHLDLIEPFKLASLTILCKAILDNKFDFQKIEAIIGRRRQEIFFVRPESVLNIQLIEEVHLALKQQGRKLSVREEFKHYFLQVKFWIQRLIEISYTIRIKHHGQEFATWTVIQYQIWQFIDDEQKRQIVLQLEKIISKLRITPYTFRRAKKGELIC